MASSTVSDLPSSDEEDPGTSYTPTDNPNLVLDENQADETMVENLELTVVQPSYPLFIRPDAIPIPHLPPNPAVFDKERDPSWVIDKEYGRHQLVEPVFKTSIGCWSVAFNMPFIDLRGFMFRNPKLASECQFDWDPERNPYEKEPENESKSKGPVLYLVFLS